MLGQPWGWGVGGGFQESPWALAVSGGDMEALHVGRPANQYEAPPNGGHDVKQAPL